MNAAPFSARLLTNARSRPWHKATPEVRAICRAAAEHCAARGVDIAQLALQFSIANEEMATCIVGSANPEQRQELGRLGGETARCATPERSDGDPPPDPQLVLHGRAAREQRPRPAFGV